MGRNESVARPIQKICSKSLSRRYQQKKVLSKTKNKVGETAGSLKYIFKCTKITYIGPEPKRTLMEGSR